MPVFLISYWFPLGLFGLGVLPAPVVGTVPGRKPGKDVRIVFSSALVKFLVRVLNCVRTRATSAALTAGALFPKSLRI